MVTVNKQSFIYVLGSYSAITAVWVVQRSHCFSYSSVAVRISLSCGYYNCLTTFCMTSCATIGHANWYQAPPNPFPHLDDFLFLSGLILGFKQNYTIVTYRFMPFRNHELTTEMGSNLKVEILIEAFHLCHQNRTHLYTITCATILEYCFICDVCYWLKTNWDHRQILIKVVVFHLIQHKILEAFLSVP